MGNAGSIVPGAALVHSIKTTTEQSVRLVRQLKYMCHFWQNIKSTKKQDLVSYIRTLPKICKVIHNTKKNATVKLSSKT